MSYDLCVRPDEHYSRKTPKQPLKVFMRGLPGLRPNGTSGFTLDDPPDRWMEIYLEVVSADGDNIEVDGKEYTEINCIRLHIPYPNFRAKKFDTEYLPTALAIARHVKWHLIDEQTGRALWTPDKA